MKEYTDRSDTITKYFREVRESDLLTVDEEVELTRKVKEGDRKAIDKLIKSNLKFVISIAKEYQGLGLPLSDLISEGNYGLIKSVEKFDPTRGYKFISYAVWWIKQSIIQSLNDNSRTIRLPTNVINKLSQLNKKNNEFEDVTTLHQLAEENFPKCVSLNDTVKGSKSDTKLVDFITEDIDDNGIYDVEINRLREVIDRTLNILDDRERGIIECYYGLNRDFEPMTLEAIGDKYGLTKERIRQIKEKAIRRLRHNNEELYILLNK